MSNESLEIVPRLLALVAKGLSDEEAEAARTGAEAQFLAQFGKSVEVLNSKAWFASTFSDCGSWDSWIWDTVSRKDYATRKPYFAGFILCSPVMGRANAQIVRLARENGRTVLLWQSGSPFSLVTGVNDVDPESWKDGWRAAIAPIE